MSSSLLCRLDEFGTGTDTPSAQGFTLENGREIFLVRVADTVFGYENRCPHTGAPLDWVPDQFLDLDKVYIQCATHDARFRIKDGFCVSGPCSGQSLRRLVLEIHEDRIHLID
ncbi:MAG: Rieske 2Fe-2S domain-containing protein [Gammaproteobacteria bacterium]|nr:Rieske 2Fe-2S domain-containing protein [Gammaproteobacteria bacterium]MCP5137541.1 Rieske 2Fe-2S domain-containing protein [Gammaproteobacteria bacterium]